MRGQSSTKRIYYFFDYLFWLGEMAQWHYKGEPRRPDGESMLMLCSMIFIYEPIFFTTAHFLYGSSVFEWFTVAMIVGSIAIIHCISRGWIYPFSRREAVMQHYEGRRFSPFRCYFFVFSLGFLIIAEAYLFPSTLMRIDGHKAEPAEHTDGSSAKVEGLPCTAYHGRSPSGSTQRSLAISDQSGWSHIPLRATGLCHAGKEGRYGRRVPCRIAEPCYF